MCAKCRKVLLLELILYGVSTVCFATEEELIFGRFGKVTLYYETPHPSQVVLFVSGDGGWNLGVIDMAKALTSLNALVVGIDIVSYVKQLAQSTEKCSYPAADFEALSQFVQKKLQFTNYLTPVLVGYSSGATLVYATLVQAPSTIFRGAISLGFCPDLPCRNLDPALVNSIELKGGHRIGSNFTGIADQILKEAEKHE